MVEGCDACGDYFFGVVIRLAIRFDSGSYFRTCVIISFLFCGDKLLRLAKQETTFSISFQPQTMVHPLSCFLLSSPVGKTEFDIKWLVEHSRQVFFCVCFLNFNQTQVMRSLCGGLTVLGFYRIGNSDKSDTFEKQLIAGRALWETHWRRYNLLCQSTPQMLILNIIDKSSRLV